MVRYNWQERADIIRATPGGQKLSSVLAGGWDPDAFVDLVEESYGIEQDPRTEPLIALQKAEWETLFELTAKSAV